MISAMDLETKRGWVAGFFDGEGCVLFCRKKGPKGNWTHMQYYLNASNTDRELVQAAHDFLGELGVKSKIEGPYQVGAKRPSWRVQVYGAANIVAFHESIPLLCPPKIEKLAQVIAYIKRDGPRRGPVTWNR